MLELRIPIRMVCSLFCFSVALQAVVQIVQYLRNLRMADRMFLSAELRCYCPCAFTNPSQGRFRIAASLAINHFLQRLQQARIGSCDGLAPSTGAANATKRWHHTFL